MAVTIVDFVSRFLNDVVSCQEFDNVEIKIRQRIHHLLLVTDLFIRNQENCQFIIDEQAKVQVSLLVYKTVSLSSVLISGKLKTRFHFLGR